MSLDCSQVLSLPAIFHCVDQFEPDPVQSAALSNRLNRSLAGSVLAKRVTMARSSALSR